jgi:uncharacterized protein (DUF433 family)
MTLPDFLCQDEFGGIRLTGHRIALYHLLAYYQEGYSAEMLLEQFPSLSMGLIHKTLAFYWDNKPEVDAYLSQVQARLEEQRRQGPTVDVGALQARMAARKPAVKAAS